MAIDRVTYVKSLEIPDLQTHAKAYGITTLVAAAPRTAPVLAEVADKPSASLIEGQVTAFTVGLSGQDKQDVEYTILAAQLNSDIKVTDNQSLNGMKAWFKNYTTVMSNLGWIMSFDWEQYHASSQGLSMDKVMIEVLAAVASQNGAAIAKAALDAMQKLPKDGDRIKMFSNSTTSGSAGKFLLGVAAKDNEAISLACGSFAMDYTTRGTTVLWFNWQSSNINIYKDQKTCTFNQDYYAKGARAALEAKLHDHAAHYVSDLNLGF